MHFLVGLGAWGMAVRLTRCAQNIDFQTTILSRFDMIFIVKDEHNEQRDRVRVFTTVCPFELLLRPHTDDRETRHEHPYEPAKPKR